MHQLLSPDILITTVDYKIALMEQRLAAVRHLAEKCTLCPRECGVNRLAGEIGTCRIGSGPVFSSANLHHGEEPPISGTRGSGTIFMTGCNLRCRFCQNFPISQLRHGIPTSPEGLADQMLNLQKRGAHNINFVTPTPQATTIFESLLIAYKQGLNIPIVYNCGGYESLEMLKLWDGIIDIYLPDSKYAVDNTAIEVSRAPDYVYHNRIALKEMHRQVGVLQLDENGIALRGLIIRHLVLPGDIVDTENVLKFIAEELSPETYISLMSQYFPAWKAMDIPALNHGINRAEYIRAKKALQKFGLENGWVQPL